MFEHLVNRTDVNLHGLSLETARGGWEREGEDRQVRKVGGTEGERGVAREEPSAAWTTESAVYCTVRGGRELLKGMINQIDEEHHLYLSVSHEL